MWVTHSMQGPNVDSNVVNAPGEGANRGIRADAVLDYAHGSIALDKLQ